MEFACTAGYVLLKEEVLSILLDDYRLAARSEEAVREAVVEWNGGTAGSVVWRSVLGKIQFPLMRKEYLMNRVVGMVGGEWIAGAVAEVLLAKAPLLEGTVVELELLGRKAVLDWVGLGVKWEEYLEGGSCSWQSIIERCQLLLRVIR